MYYMEKEESYCGSGKKKKKKHARGRNMLVRSVNKEAMWLCRLNSEEW